MNKTLTYEQMMALFAEGHKETAELRNGIADLRIIVNGNLTEVDALLENGKFVIAVEAKTDMQVSDVNKHILDFPKGHFLSYA
ncbi:MAG: hypothetical protein LBH25_02720 [Fibromonadaceae bacterium]|jgi:hypothetical protein|nr:hypothetical protein [Fibromonadaceae bacterium]